MRGRSKYTAPCAGKRWLHERHVPVRVMTDPRPSFGASAQLLRGPHCLETSARTSSYLAHFPLPPQIGSLAGFAATPCCTAASGTEE